MNGGTAPQAMMFCGLYICVAEKVLSVTIAKGATVKVIEKKSTADLRKAPR